MPMVIKIGKMVSYYKRPPRIKSCKSLNMWSHEVARQIKYEARPLVIKHGKVVT